MSENIGKNEATAKATAGKNPENQGWPVWPKHEWPELVGKDGETAKATILNENPNLYVEIHKPGPWSADIISNRVRIAVDENGIVIQTPKIG